jgi:hypothetical protein
MHAMKVYAGEQSYNSTHSSPRSRSSVVVIIATALRG